ncbi:MAG: DUF6763 family protein [Steroidobacteraceae bacterium]
MNVRNTPEPEQWYVDRLTGDMFQVVSVNEDDDSIGIQYADGALEEKSLDEWATMGLESCEQPEDWVGPYDDLESDDIGMPETSVEARGAELPMERALLEIEEQRGPDLTGLEG